MSKRKHIIIGSGPAALSAVDQIRSINQDDQIKVVSKQGNLPYSPAILPYLLSGKAKEEDVWLRDEKYFRKMKVTLANGKEVVKVLPDRKQVVYLDGEVDKYDDLLIASGAEPATSPVKGLNDGVSLSFHTLDDYHRLDEMLNGSKDVAVLGAGMIAMELALALVERGCKVKMVGRGRPLRAYFDEQAGGYIRDIFISHGVEITTGKNIKEVGKSRRGIEILCDDGEVFKADLLVSCLGVNPKLSLVEGSGINVNQGIIVDDRMRANVENIYAAGDVAEAPNFFNHRPGISAILPNAVAQGEVAGINMAGKECSYQGWISMNLLNMFGNYASAIGVTMPEGDQGKILEEKNDEKKYLKRLVIHDGRLIGGMFVNADVDPGIILYLIEKKIDISAHKEALFEKTKEMSRWLMLEAERKA